MWNLSRHVCAMASQRVKPIFEPNGILRSHRSCHHYTVTVFSLIRVHDTTVIYGSQVVNHGLNMKSWEIHMHRPLNCFTIFCKKPFKVLGAHGREKGLEESGDHARCMQLAWSDKCAVLMLDVKLHGLTVANLD